ncbi:cysteine desulfurase [Orbus hercynius]|uniref:cysteine desulfurase n=1 Tax=Orbus hercynius TaxID=593135 RepID=A0A495RB80_9GAMM|nr:cysteine desulfurase CsdA [Orbus hercynius]RKS84536.1 cysteine desulfurase [Orbus hercynius]
MMFDSSAFRSYFPSRQTDEVYLDSASTSLKPQMMIDATTNYYTHNAATILRSKHAQALALTEQVSQVRILTAKLINAEHSHEIIWSKGATESINLVAQSYARYFLQANDEIIVSELEHHSNIIPWLQVAAQTGAKVVKWPIEADGNLSTDHLLSIMSVKTRIVAVTQMSNVTGFEPNLAVISDIAHQFNAIVVVDGAQGIVHRPIDVQQYDIDFYVFSAHKLYGPTGLGILYGKSALLQQMDCGQGGGKMLKSASFSGFEPADLPYKFEAGTPNIAALVGFHATLTWLTLFDHNQAHVYVQQLVDYCQSQLSRHLPELTCISTPNSPLLTLVSSTIHHDDIAILLAEQNIAIRAGELCAQPLIKALGYRGVVRASWMPYNNQTDADRLISALQSAVDILK